jgi:hypothetical protein
MKTIYDLITDEGFRKRPAMWIGKKSITVLKTFIAGYEVCEDFNKISPALTPPFHLFLPWIQNLYNHNGSYYNWDGIILQNSSNDEAQALDKFLELFDEFKQLKKTTVAAADITDATAAHFLPPKDADELFAARAIGGFKHPAPDKLFIVEYDKEFGCTIYHRANENITWNSELLLKLHKRMRLMFNENQWVGTMPNKLS